MAPKFSMDKLENYKPNLGVYGVFESSQNSVKSHNVLINKLFKCYEEENNIKFTYEFLQCLTIIFSCKENSCVNNIIEFATSYAVYHQCRIVTESDIFANFLYSFISKFLNSKFSIYRLHIVEFIYQILQKFPADYEIFEHVFNELRHFLLNCLQDKLTSVRAKAVSALEKLQDPRNPNCLVMKDVIFHMEHDPSSSVRKNCVEIIARTKHTLKLIINRILDVSEIVRMKAYTKLSKVNIKYLSIKNRQHIIESGLNDGSEDIQNHVKKIIIKTWLDQCKNNVLELLALLDVMLLKNDVLQNIIFLIFKEEAFSTVRETLVSLQTKKIISVNNLNVENSSLWRFYMQYLLSNENNNENDVQQFVPELKCYIQFLREYLKKYESKNTPKLEFILIQLLEIINYYVVMDEAERQDLKLFCISTLTNDIVRLKPLPILMKLLTKVLPDSSERIKVVAEAVADIRQPLKMIQNSTCNNTLSLKSDESRINDPDVVIKCVSIINEFLLERDVKIDGTILAIDSTFLEPFQYNNNAVSSLVLSVRTKLFLKDVNFAKRHLSNVFVMLVKKEGSDEVFHGVLKLLFDVILMYGFDILTDDNIETYNPINVENQNMSETFFDDNEKNISPLKSNLLKLFSYYLDIQDSSVVIIVEGLIKLMISGKLKSPIILSKIILLYYYILKTHDISTELKNLSSHISKFFPFFKDNCNDSSEILFRAVLPTIKMLNLNIVEGNKYIDIDPSRVLMFFIYLLDDEKTKDNYSYNYKLAILFCDEILIQNHVPFYISTLSKIKLTPDDFLFIDPLLQRIDDSIKMFKQSQQRKYVTIMQNCRDRFTTCYKKSDTISRTARPSSPEENKNEREITSTSEH